MKKLLLATFLLTSFNASASWIKDELSGEFKDKLFAALYDDKVGLSSVALFSQNEECKEYSSKAYEMDAVKINGVWVKQNIQCVGGYIAIVYPATVDGLTYVVKEFKESKVVSYEYKSGSVLRFSATGFTKAYNKKLWESEIDETAI